MADDLTIEVTGSAEKAASALDKIIQKITDLQERFDKAAPSVSKFASQMEQIASSSKAFQAFQKMAGGIDKQAVSTKNAESKMAMYQARLDRANVSMERSRVQSEKLAASLVKVSEAQKIAEANSAAFSMSPADFAAKYNHSSNGGADLTPQTSEGTEAGPAPVNVPVEKFDVSKIQANIDSMKPKISIDADSAMAELQRMGEYIDGLRPRISGMSEEAQAQFNALAAKLELVSRQIDNQRNAYRGLQSAALKAEQEQGNGSDAYLKLEKRILSADAASQRLAATQEKLKAELASVASGASAAGEQSERAARRSTSGWQKTFDMFGRMFIRIAAFKIYSAIAQGITTGIQNIAQADSQANATMSQLATSVQYLQNSIAAALMPVLEALAPVIVQVADAISWAANQLAIFIAQVTGQKTVTIATKSYVDYAKSLNSTGNNASNANKQVKELQRTIMGFDELNVLNKNVNDALASSPKSNVPDYSSMFKTIPTPKSNFDPSSLFKDVPKIFDKLKDAADKGGKALDKVKDKAKELQDELNKVKLPSLGEWKVPAAPKIPVFPPVPAPAIGEWKIPDLPKIPDFPPIKAPVIPPIKVPEWDFGGYDKSKQKYQQPVPAPFVLPGTAPALDSGEYEDSKKKYQAPVAAPVITAGIIPALVLTGFEQSIEAAKQRIQSFSDSTQQTVNAWKTNISNNTSLTWAYVSTATATSLVGVNLKINQWKSSASKAFADAGTNIMKNMRSTFVYVPEAVGAGLNEAGKRVSSWLTSTGKGFAGWGENLVSNIGKTMSAWYSSFVGALSSAWSQFTSFMSATGKKISGWWDTNKSWVIPTAIGIGVGVYAVSAIATGGATLAAAPALAALANGALVTEPTDALIGEGHYDEAVLPLSPDVFSQIAQGIQRNSDAGTSDAAIAGAYERLDRIEKAIEELAKRPTYLYTDDRKIAQSSNRGNRLLGRTAPTA